MSKGNGSSSLQDLSEKAFEIARRRQSAATAVVEMLEAEFESTFESHAATLLRAAAWLAGTSLYRSFGLPGDAAPGSPVLSDHANEQGPRLLKVFLVLIGKDGVELKPEQIPAEIPAEQQPRKTILQVQQQFEKRYNEIMQRNGFDFADGARSGAVACARLVRLHCQDRKDLDPTLAAGIVAMGFVEGSKTAPAP